MIIPVPVFGGGYARSATSGAVPDDDTHAAIDRIFDFVDKGADLLGHAIGRGEQSKERLDRVDARRTKRDVIETEAKEVRPAKPKAPTTSTSMSTAIVKKPRFYITESISDGRTIFAVTDGSNARAECTSRELAEKLLRALEAAP